MSSDYRPRSGSGGGESGGGRGGRRRRGGRGRGPSTSSHGHSHGESRAHSNGTHTPKKKEGFISKLLGIFKGKKKPEPKPARSESMPRHEVRDREPRAERSERPERPRREDRPPKADPTPQEITTPKLYVGNLAYEAAESDLFDLFSKIGAVKNVEVAMDRRANRSKGFGFVEMETLDTAKQAAEKLNRTDFLGRQIVVSGAKLDKRPIGSSREESTDAPSESETESTGESTI
jgi:RNA recognition motif-containing protein